MARKRTEIEPRGTMDEDPVVRAILKAISLKRIRPGAKLGEAELAAFFNTNRTHIRQALSHLGSCRVVTLYPNRGAFVAQPSPKEAREVFATRRVLEVETVSLLIDGMDDGKAAILRKSLHCDHHPLPGDRWDTLEIGAEFHTAIARLAGNNVLTKFVEELVLRTSLIISRFEATGHGDHSADAHPIIADLIIARDKPKAVAAMVSHLTQMEHRLPLDEDLRRLRPSISAIFGDIGIEPLPKKRSAAR